MSYFSLLLIIHYMSYFALDSILFIFVQKHGFRFGCSTNFSCFHFDHWIAANTCWLTIKYLLIKSKFGLAHWTWSFSDEIIFEKCSHCNKSHTFNSWVSSHRSWCGASGLVFGALSFFQACARARSLCSIADISHIWNPFIPWPFSFFYLLFFLLLFGSWVAQVELTITNRISERTSISFEHFTCIQFCRQRQ